MKWSSALMTDSIDRYPQTVIAGVDWRNLRKGDRISAKQVNEMWGVIYPTRTRDDRFVATQVKDWLEKARHSIGKPLVIKQQNEDFVVLTDEQAVAYLNGQAGAGLRKHRKNTQRMFHDIDVDNLSSHGKDELAVNQARHALIQSAADGARKTSINLLRKGAKLPQLLPPDE